MVYRIIIAVSVEVKSAGCIWVEVGCIIGGDESAPSGVIVTSIQEVEARLCIEVITSVADRIISGEIITRVGCNLLFNIWGEINSPHFDSCMINY